MKIFVTDKYRIFTFMMICALIGGAAMLFGRYPSSPASAPQKLVPIYSVKRSDSVIAVTFDCAWGADDIEDIISVLKKHNCPATFFVLGTWAEKYPDAAQSIVKNGHEIANHSYNHDYYTKMTPDEMLEDIKKCNDIIKRITNTVPTLFRAPSGDYNNSVVETCRSAGITYLQWSVDSLDWKGLTGEEMLGRILPKIQNGDILLFHNGTAHTAESLDDILTQIEKKGFHFMKASDMIYKDNYYIDHTGRQIKQ